MLNQVTTAYDVGCSANVQLRHEQEEPAIVLSHARRESESASANDEARNGATSGSVNDRAIDSIPDVSIPSVKMGPTKCCIFGVKRKGTTSFVAKIGID
jgi:hypothetical protein